MFRRFFLTLRLRSVQAFGLAALFLAACQPEATPPPPPPATATATAPASTPVATPSSLPHADAIRFALVGETKLTNVWAYYEEPGANYNNRAVQAGFWPSLFHLSPLTGEFEPYLAEWSASSLEPDSNFFASNVVLRPGLFWSDGSPVTAEDVAFTVNAALTFRLGFDWEAYYDSAVVYHAEALDERTVRFYFRVQPAIEDWQFGALQGPVVNAAYWEPRLVAANAMLLPNPELDKAILKLQEELARLQRELNDLLYQLNLLDISSNAYESMQRQIYDKQEEINGVLKAMDTKNEEKEAVFAAARQALYELDSADEPTFGPFAPSKQRRNEFENAVNPFYPFTPPNFDRAIYHVYADEQSAMKALTQGKVNAVLRENGVSDSEAQTGDAVPFVSQFPRRNLRVLAFNLTTPLSETALRQAIVCMATQPFFPTKAYYPGGLILSPTDFGFTAASPFPCAGFDAQARLEWSVGTLEAAGYAWEVRPAWEGAARAGSGLKRDGATLPGFRILVAREDDLRVATASAIVSQLRLLGLDVSVEKAEASEALYRVFDSHQFDMVILGWRLARYPSYLCGLFGPGNSYGYERAEMAMHCAAFRSALSLEAAREETYALQTLLAGDAPAAPLYSEAGYDALAGVTYPFGATLDGISGLYGAPWLAIPAP
jgi:ABC-type transport system substrate-binding protein